MTHLKVAVRVRPLSDREIEKNPIPIVSIEDGSTIAVTNIKVPEQNAGDSRERIRRFTFDYCFQEDATQDKVEQKPFSNTCFLVFEAVEEVISQSIRDKYHSCVLAYGQSSSGKTHTMMGFPHDPGLTPRLCERVFSYIIEPELKVSVSYLEIYNEKVRDLLVDDDELKLLKIREHPKNGPYVQGLTDRNVADGSELLKVLELGNSKRRVASTLSNPQSSRSHSLVTISCDKAKLHLVDLAGSERAGSRCFSSCRFREGANINKSLVALGNVISALAEQQKTRRRFVPFRDSLLTWLLKDTLGGNSNTIMIATVSPSSSCYNETVNTLRFGQRAKKIITRPVINEDPKERVIKELRAEILRLKELLEASPVLMNLEKPPVKTEELVSVFEVEVQNQKPVKKLKRTFSVDGYKMEKPPEPAPKKKPNVLQKTKSLQRKSIDSTTSSGSNKSEVGTSTELKPYLKVGPKVDSIRKQPFKPRAQIIASVTNRLYSKIKKKEIGTDTDDLSGDRIKELSICSNARMRMRELTQKALKAHRSKAEETQTDLFPVLRLKEVSTCSEDLKLALEEVKDVETTYDIEVKSVGIDCNLLSKETKNVGVQFSREYNLLNNLVGEDILPDIKELGAIFTKTVNINISHNYASKSEEQAEANLICLPAPDLLSNHNSLEAGAEPLYAFDNQIILDTFLVSPFETTSPIVAKAQQTLFNSEADQFVHIERINSFAAEIRSLIIKEKCLPLSVFKVNVAQAQMKEIEGLKMAEVGEATVLKSIMRNCEECSESRCTCNDIPDSLEYHLANSAKKVHFKQSNSERMFKAMSSFLEEATILMHNLTTAAGKFDERVKFFDDFDLEVTVNDIRGYDKRKKEDIEIQTDQITEDQCSQTVNKYEVMLEESCRRLEEKINAKVPRSFTDEDSFVFNPWDLSNSSNYVEDSSIESNAPYSDYGSLPRRTYKRQRTPTCSPSAFLKQLTSMRKQVIESSREELLNNH